MKFTEEDRNALYHVWMSQKAKRHLTQMDMAKRMGISVVEFSNMIRGDGELTEAFLSRFCQLLSLDSHILFPSLKEKYATSDGVVYLQNKVIIDGDIQEVRVDGNQVIINYRYKLNRENG